MKIVYIIGGIHAANGMSDVLTRKVNWLAANTKAQLHVVLTERPDLQPFYKLHPSVRVVNFNLNFDRLDTLPLWRKVPLYAWLMRRYRRCLTSYLAALGADVVVSALRRDINFLADIGDGSRKVGELHFSRASYRVFARRWLPGWVCRAVTRRWQASLVATLRRLDAFVVLSHEDAAAWPELAGNIHVIPNSIRPEQPDADTAHTPADTQAATKQPTPPQRRQAVLAAGRYTHQKGFDLLLHSWAVVETVAPGWSLDIFGSGDPTPYVVLARRLCLRRVTFHGATPHLRREMRCREVFAFSSRYEGFGLVLAEAMAEGMAVVSYACPCGPRDIITNEADGLLVDEVGNAGAMARALLRLIRDTPLRRRLAAAAQLSARRFDEDAVMQQWISLLRDIATHAAL